LVDIPVRESRRRGAVPAVGSQCLAAGTLVERVPVPLAAHDVSDLEVHLPQHGELLWAQYTTDFELHLNSHSQLRGLGGGQFIHALFDHSVVNRLGVECLIQSKIRLAQPPVRNLPLGLGFFANHSDSLALLGCEAELFDRIGRNILCRILRGSNGAEGQE